MAKIFISTNDYQPENCFKNGTDDSEKMDKWINNNKFPNPNNVVVIQENIILISDKLDKIPETINLDKDEDFLLYHNETNDKVKNLFKTNHIKKGHHTQDKDHLYKPVFEILLNDNISFKHTEILKTLGSTQQQLNDKQRLNVGLQFLHQCLSERPSDLKLLTNAGVNVYAECKSEKIKGKTILGLFNEFKVGNKDTLVAIRDAIFEQVGME